MTESTHQAPCYIPLNLISQNNCEQVLYYNANAPLKDIYKIATQRLKIAINLADYLNNHTDTTPPPVNESLSTAISLLLSDCLTLLEEFNPTAIALRIPPNSPPSQ